MPVQAFNEHAGTLIYSDEVSVHAFMSTPDWDLVDLETDSSRLPGLKVAGYPHIWFYVLQIPQNGIPAGLSFTPYYTMAAYADGQPIPSSAPEGWAQEGWLPLTPPQPVFPGVPMALQLHVPGAMGITIAFTVQNVAATNAIVRIVLGASAT